MSWDVGDTYQATLSATDPDTGEPRDPDTLVIRIRAPQTDAPLTYVFGVDAAVVKDATGEYHAEFLLTRSGVWSYHWQALGAAAGVEEGSVYVRESAVVGDGQTWSYDLTASLGELRLYLDDHDFSSVSATTPPEKRSAIWTDQELELVLARQGGSVKLAVSVMLRALANNRSLLVQSRRILDTSVDYGSIRADLLKQADAWRAEAIAEGETDYGPADGVAEQAWTVFGRDRIIENAMLRNNG